MLGHRPPAATWTVPAAVRRALFLACFPLLGRTFPRHLAAYSRDDARGVPPDRSLGLLDRLLAHCRRNVPWYGPALAGGGDPLECLRRLPVLTKPVIREHLPGLLARDLSSRRWFYQTSGGSTGEPVRLVQDMEYADRSFAVTTVFSAWAGRRIGEPEVRLWGSEREVLHGSVGLRARVFNALTNTAWMNAFRMTPAGMRAMIEVLRARPPRLLVAYAQAACELARFAAGEGLAPLRLPAVMTSAGTLFPFMREAIERFFGAPVYNRYGSREVGDIASQCERRAGLHVAPWTQYVEILDDAGQPVPAGRDGRIVITNLANYAMPLLRYDIGDRGALDGGACACGRGGQVLARVLGRTVDAFRTSEGALVDGEYFTHLLYFRAWVRRFQVVQRAAGEVVFRLVSDGRPDPAELSEIAAQTCRALGPRCRVRFEFPADIPASPSGKFRYTISEV